MQAFSYRAFSQTGTLAQGVVEAASEAAATDLIFARGLTPFEMQAVLGLDARPWWQRDVFVSTHLGLKELAEFTREFATLVPAGLTVDEILRLMLESPASRRLGDITRSLLADVTSGKMLSDAMQRHGGFPGEYTSIIGAGEARGRLVMVLEDLTALLERRLQIAEKIRSALVYPAVLGVMGIFTVGVIMSVLVPNIAPIFADSRVAMPASIAFLLGLQGHFQLFWVRDVLVIAAILGLLMLAMRSAGLRLWLDGVKLGLPVIGPAIRSREAGRLGRTLGTLLKAGVPILQALEITGKVVSNRRIRASFGDLGERVRQGQTLAAALRADGLFPPRAIRFAGIGEEAGKLDQMLLHMAGVFETQSQDIVDRWMTMLVPALTLLIGTAVGGLIMSVMSAILSINEVIMP